MNKLTEVTDYEYKFLSWFHSPEGGGGLRSERFYDSLDRFASKQALAAGMLPCLKTFLSLLRV